MLKRSRKWVVTINNYDKEDIAKFDNLECRYSMRSLEKGEKTALLISKDMLSYMLPLLAKLSANAYLGHL